MRTSTQRSAPDAEASIRVQTTVAVNEPLVSVVVRAGCVSAFSRRYVLLADPLSEPAVVSGSQQGTPVAPASQGTQSPLPALAAATPTRRGATPAEGSPSSEVISKGGTEARVAKLAKPVKPASVVRRLVEPTKDATPRLQLDPVDLSLAIERDPELKLSLSLLSEPTSNEQERTAAAQLWKALNASPEEVLRDAQKLSVLEAEAKGLREQETHNRTALQEMQAQVDQARYMTWLAYLLGGLLLLSLLGAFFLWRRRGSSSTTSGARDWWAGGSEEKPKVSSLKTGAAVASVRGIDIDLNLDDESGFDDLKQLLDGGSERRAPVLSATDRRDFPSSQPGVSRSVATEELFDVQQQSDFFVSLGEYDQAIEVLKNHLSESQEPSALAYLDLFKLYHKLGRRDDYKKLREEFNRQFNAGAPLFDQYTDESSGLEAYETAFGRIQALWPQPKVLDVIEQSIFKDANDTEAEVFDLEAYRELLLLHAIAKDMINRDSDSSSQRADFQHTAIKPLKAAGNKALASAVATESREGRATQPLDDLPPASLHLGLDVDLDALSEMSAFEASLPDVAVPVEATAKPAPPPGTRSSEVQDGNLIDFEVLDFMAPDDIPDAKNVDK
ncbi:type IV pilus assembly protein FimV [Hydrogenophaga sp. A37]